MPRIVFEKKIERLREKAKGELIVKEYPTSSVGAAHFRHLLNELKVKKGFVPDIVYIDYINLCISSRLKGGNHNSYTIVKAISEELRGLAMEFNVAIFSATQLTRSGFTASDVGLEDTAESFGLPATADFMFALITSEILAKLNQIQVKQLKNRYTDKDRCLRFIIGYDKPKMRFYDTEQESQDLIGDNNEVPDSNSSANDSVMDSTEFGHREERRKRYGPMDGFC
jgi:DnaB-like helicase C terminal domain